MEAPHILISTVSPEKGKKIDTFDKHSKYIVKVLAPTELSEALFQYAEYFFEAAHIITEFILYAEHPDIGKLDTYFFFDCVLIQTLYGAWIKSNWLSNYSR